MTPTREIYWNIDGHLIMYFFAAIMLGIFAFGIVRRYRLWKVGQPENRWSAGWQGVKDIFIYGFGHKRILKDFTPGVMHLALLVGFIFLFFATAMITLQADFGINIFQGALYIFIKITTNLFGLLAMIGVLYLFYRRYSKRPAKLDNQKDDLLALTLILMILVTGFFLQGFRMASEHDPWATYGFAGYWMIEPLQAIFSQEQLLAMHKYTWWFHMLIAFAFIAYLPYSKLFHIVLGPINQFLRQRGPVGVPELIDFEDESQETFGLSEFKQLSWKAIFNSDVCIRCGRCQEDCPAYVSGKHLNPKQTIQDIKGRAAEEYHAVCQAKKEAKHSAKQEGVVASGEAAATVDGTAALEIPPGRALIGDVIAEQDIWDCTTCRSCEQQCPVFVEHVDKTVEMRRNLVLMESRFPSEAQLAFRNMENNGNPWGIGWNKREEFLKGLEVPTLVENPEAEILYWPGCSGAFDARNQKVSAALVKLLRAAKVNFAILGNEEKCCGDSARKLGNEFLYQTLAAENIEVMKGYGVKKVITQCPHCFQTLSHDYPQLGGKFEVVHHTTYLKELIDSGRLRLSDGENLNDGESRGEELQLRMTYHDSCYLGRYNKIYSEPREILKKAGLKVIEMKRTKEKSFCCGAGGGRMWLEEHEGERINELRTEEALATGAEIVGTACPFCLTMFNDGLNAKEEAAAKTKALDIAEILAQKI
ncbi:heterodisulfide reductase-related iron-sulfur binding cluster [Desulfitobacterium sp. THU1]|uniref:heterodisulfide reductase-related iron-sulfur binding cluster n=1 Tax=Desulfitobacterium sp. THU1 TaxID=3138072 RepID=UPI00311F8AB3